MDICEFCFVCAVSVSYGESPRQVRPGEVGAFHLRRGPPPRGSLRCDPVSCAVEGVGGSLC